MMRREATPCLNTTPALSIGHTWLQDPKFLRRGEKAWVFLAFGRHSSLRS